MSTTLADAYLRLRPDTRTLGPELRDGAEKAAGGAGEQAGHTFGTRFKTAALAIASGAAVVGGIVAVGAKQAIDAARDLGETQSKVNVIFGKSGADIRKWAENAATDMGQSTKAAMDGAATFALYGKQAGMAGADLFNFSTDLSGLASDMASFSNTSPEEAIEAIGAAFRGESDPIEKYGVLLNEARLQQVAMEKGIIKTSVSLPKLRAANVAVEAAQRKYNEAVKEHGKNSLEARKASAALGLAQDRVKTITEGTTKPLTAQQRVLAVQAALYDQLGKKGSGTLGDFERTSAGLANQQRILAAQSENLKAKIGSALLPVVTALVTTITSRLMPQLDKLWTQYGPGITDTLTRWAGSLDGLAKKAGTVDWGEMFDKARQAIAELMPAIRDAKQEVPSWHDSMKVAGVVMGFLADHADELAAALPYLVAGLIAVRVAQLGANVAQALSPAIALGSMLAQRRLAAANLQLAGAITSQTAATTGNTVSKAANTAAENSGVLAKIRGTAATVAQRAATVIGTVATWAATAATTALGVAIKFATGPIGIIITVIALLAAGIVYLYKNNETARKIIDAVWAGIKIAIKAVGDWFVHTLWPSLQKAFGQLMTVARLLFTVWSTVWKGVWTVISTYYTFMWQRVFQPLIGFITRTIPDAFRTGTAAIGRAWSAVQDLAARPVRFLVDTVLNRGIIGSLNWLADKVGISKRIPTISWSSGSSGGSRPRGDLTSGNIRGDGYGMGDGKGQGDGLGSLLTNPARWLADRVGVGRLADRFGNNPFVGIVTGGATRMRDMALEKVKDWVGELFGGGGGSVGEGGLRSGILSVVASLRGRFGSVPIISGLRPGSTTLSGATSYHASGRAVDLPAVRAWAEYLRAVWGPRLRELITPWRDINMWNGAPHRYSHAIEAQHGVFGSNAHIHAALDDGGRRYLLPGLNVIPNGTGAREPIYGPAEISAVVEKLAAILAVLHRLAPAIGDELRGTTRGLRTAVRSA